MNTPQFDLSAMLTQQTAVQQIPCEMLHPYHNHKFELYTGERLEDMVASIKENGVLSPIIVQPDGDGYEILIGHNRWNASKLAGLPSVPAIIKAGLTEDEAEMYVIESNVMQRGFENLRICLCSTGAHHNACDSRKHCCLLSTTGELGKPLVLRLSGRSCLHCGTIDRSHIQFVHR